MIDFSILGHINVRTKEIFNFSLFLVAKGFVKINEPGLGLLWNQFLMNALSTGNKSTFKFPEQKGSEKKNGNLYRPRINSSYTMKFIN